MPELPDLQVFAANLTRMLKGKKLHRVAVYHKSKNSSPQSELDQQLTNQKLRSVHREGKQLYFDFGRNAIIAMHLMLHGKLVLVSPEDDPPGHALLAFDFGDQLLFLTDFQKAANIRLNPPPMQGMDALSGRLRAKWLQEKLSGTKANVKAVITNQEVISGIGNAYADEILYDAGIAPGSRSDKIPPDAVAVLAGSISKVLHEAEQKIREKDPDIIAGEIRDFMAIHNSKKKTSPTGAKILVKKVGGRSTYYTGEQQEYH